MLRDALEKLEQLHRLRDRESDAEPGRRLPFFRSGGERDDFHLRDSGIAKLLPAELDAVHHRHAHVEEHDAEIGAGPQGVEPFFPVRGLDDGVPLVLEHFGDGGPQVPVILY